MIFIKFVPADCSNEENYYGNTAFSLVSSVSTFVTFNYNFYHPSDHQLAVIRLRKMELFLSRARVTIQNYYQYRHVDESGWKLGWTWANNEIIWSMSGAFATTQGDCSQFKSQTPHSCKRSPVIADLMPDAPPESRTDGCCHGGLIASWAVNPSKSFSCFEMKVGNLSDSNLKGPVNLTLMAPGPGYTCGLVEETDPSSLKSLGSWPNGQKHQSSFGKLVGVRTLALSDELWYS
ncbi:COBRA-like protein 1-like protein [Corchorus olitorius]|uniref:COBRA-like protein 1-like protein n=1 Tax=Corchorus olitorius TaxID=93759 RepID=A0A1R3JDI1_9ROSI|nr:COBRA-like protein 1-like protein [Corchorus olitorius]